MITALRFNTVQEIMLVISINSYIIIIIWCSILSQCTVMSRKSSHVCTLTQTQSLFWIELTTLWESEAPHRASVSNISIKKKNYNWLTCVSVPASVLGLFPFFEDIPFCSITRFVLGIETTRAWRNWNTCIFFTLLFCTAPVFMVVLTACRSTIGSMNEFHRKLAEQSLKYVFHNVAAAPPEDHTHLMQYLYTLYLHAAKIQHNVSVSVSEGWSTLTFTVKATCLMSFIFLLVFLLLVMHYWTMLLSC